jgi:DNA-damage-inducible protein J
MNSYVRARIDDDIRIEASAVLENIGLSLSDVIRVVVTRIAKDKAIPIGLFIPNAATIAAMTEAREIMAKNLARFQSSEEMFSALEDSSGQTKG